MKKAIILLVAIVTFILSFATLAYANMIDNATVTNAQNGVFLVEGTFEPNINNRMVSIFVLKNGKTLEDAIADGENSIVHIGYADVRYDGSYSYTFTFNSASDDYVFCVVNDQNIQYKNFFYGNWADVEILFSNIVSGTLSNDTLIAQLTRYSVSLGIDMTTFDNAVKKDLVAKRINENKATIATGKQQAIVELLETARTEITMLESLQNASIWNQIHPILNATKEITGIVFSQYDKVILKQNIDSKMLKKVFANREEVKEFFDKTVADELARQESGNKGSGNSSSTPRGKSTGGSFSPKNEEAFPVEPVAKLKPVFDDLSDVEWARTAIEYLYLKNIVAGTSEKTFNPNGNILREEFVKMVVLAFDKYQKSAKVEFSDVKSDDWCYSYVASAKDAGLIYGDENNSFNKGAYISRQDLAVILYRMAIKEGFIFKEKDETFKDYNEISDYAKEAVANLAGAKFINGMENGNFAPNANATRAQTALLVNVMMGGLK